MIFIANLNQNMSEEEWNKIWARAVPVDVQEILATEDPDEGRPADPGEVGGATDRGVPHKSMTLKQYAQFIANYARGKFQF